jgi:hypothetical protein
VPEITECECNGPEISMGYTPFPFLEIDHTMWNETSMPGTSTSTNTSCIKVFPVGVCLVYGFMVGTCSTLKTYQKHKISRTEKDRPQLFHGMTSNVLDMAMSEPYIPHHHSRTHHLHFSSFSYVPAKSCHQQQGSGGITSLETISGCSSYWTTNT